MTMKNKIHIFGASGAGTTTIGRLACGILGYTHFDTDDYFWMPTDEPFTLERPENECLEALDADLAAKESWILSGSVMSWGNPLIPRFELAIFVSVPRETRIERLKKREVERYGNRILPGGDRYEDSQWFIEWAASYDDGTREGRSLPKHEAWLERFNCPVLRITNLDLDESVGRVVDAIRA